MIEHCPLCGNGAAQPVFDAEVPLRIMTALDRSQEAEPFVPFALVACATCGHLYNRAFDGALIDAMYGDAPLTNVPVHPSMIDRLSSLLDWLGPDTVVGRDVVEIGSGSGHLARLLAAQARSVRLFEPNRNLTGAMLPEPNITLVNAHFPCDLGAASVDTVFCRQVLEHVPDPFAILRAIRAALRSGGRAYLEVPDACYVVRHGAFADLHAQHVQYFDRDAFAALAARAGLRRLKTLEIKDGHDFGMLFEAAAPATDPGYCGGLFDAAAFGRHLATRLEAARRAVAGLAGPVVLYGATAQGQAFVNAVSLGAVAGTVLDDNSALFGFALFNRTHRFVIRPPTELDRAAEAVVILAYLHDEAIARNLRAAGYRNRILTTRPAPLSSGADILESVFGTTISI